MIDMFKALAGVCELEVTPKAGTSNEYKQYVKDRDKESKN